jgi:hypothetical protein
VVTSEAEKSSYYFWSVSHPVAGPTSDPEFCENYYGKMRKVISEDVEVLTAQHEAIELFGGHAECCHQA